MIVDKVILTEEEVNRRLRGRHAVIDTSGIVLHIPADFDCVLHQDGKWCLSWRSGITGQSLTYIFDEDDVVSMMEHGGTFQGTLYRDSTIVHEITVEDPEEEFIPSNNDEGKQKAQAQQEEPMEERQYVRESLVGKMVRVEWYDHCALNDWLRLDQIFAEPLLVITIGEVVAETDASLVVAATISNETKFHWPKCNDAQVIVRAAIKNIEVLNIKSMTH